MSTWNESQWAVIDALANAYIAPLTAAEIDRVCPTTSKQAHLALANKASAELPQFRSTIKEVTKHVPAEKLKQLGIVLSALSYRVTAAPLTGSHKLMVEMTPDEVSKVIKSWKNSKLAPLNLLAAQFAGICMFGFLYGSPAVLESAGYDFRNPIFDRLCTGALFVPTFTTQFQQNYDVIVIGSGCGGGVAAAAAAKAGYSVLVVEKGKYIDPADISAEPHTAEDQAFEQGGKIMSEDASIAVLAASTVGGGGAVNWSCSLPTPFAVRQEWSEEVPWYASTEYDDAKDYVFEKMKVSTDFGAPHSFTNQLILDSSKMLEYPAKVAPQNTGLHPHNNRFRGYGYRSGEKGGISVWLEEACANGAVMAPNANAVRIVHSGSKASGVELDIDGKRVFVGGKRIVCSGGSLLSPALLLRSKFKNKHIGRHLKLHPVTVVYGDFDEVVNKPDDPIMTAVCTQCDNLDGKHHGPKIEAIHTIPHLMGKFLPFNNGHDNAVNLLRYAHLAALLVITRDTTEGQVCIDKYNPFIPHVYYTTNKYDLWAIQQGCIASANMLYLGGAQRIIMPDSGLPVFETERPAHARRLADSDFQHWLEKVKAWTIYNYSVAIGCAHQMGSVRMSARGAKHGAVDDKGRLYECNNVHVIDASVFPSASGVNPMISTLCTAKILSDKLVRSLQESKL